MKKLMIAAAIVCAAAISQAASFDWKLQIGGATTADAYNTAYHVYLVNAATWDALGAEGQTYDALLANKLDTATFGSPTGKSATNKTYDMDVKTIINPTLDTGDTMGVYYMLVKDVGSTPDTYIAIADTLTGRASDGTEKLGTNWEQTKATLPAAASFAGGAVPEPTSGLLLLLGVAGLALRRRRV